jgi:hypothetical protein
MAKKSGTIPHGKHQPWMIVCSPVVGPDTPRHAMRPQRLGEEKKTVS